MICHSIRCTFLPSARNFSTIKTSFATTTQLQKVLRLNGYRISHFFHRQFAEEAALKDASAMCLAPSSHSAVHECVLEIQPKENTKETWEFCRELLAMYWNYSVFKGWRILATEAKGDETGTFQHGFLNISGVGSFERLAFEGGVHKAKRESVSGKQGAVMACSAIVNVLPLPNNNERPDVSEIKVDAAPVITTAALSTVSKTEESEREQVFNVTHVPTGTTVQVTNWSDPHIQELHLKRLIGMVCLPKFLDTQTPAPARKLQIGKYNSDVKIRDYNFIYDKIQDARLKRDFLNIAEILQGDEAFDAMLNAIAEFHSAERLAELPREKTREENYKTQKHKKAKTDL